MCWFLEFLGEINWTILLANWQFCNVCNKRWTGKWTEKVVRNNWLQTKMYSQCVVLHQHAQLGYFRENTVNIDKACIYTYIERGRDMLTCWWIFKNGNKTSPYVTWRAGEMRPNNHATICYCFYYTRVQNDNVPTTVLQGFLPAYVAQ